jgi:hypothetical protein
VLDAGSVLILGRVGVNGGVSKSSELNDAVLDARSVYVRVLVTCAFPLANTEGAFFLSKFSGVKIFASHPCCAWSAWGAPFRENVTKGNERNRVWRF